MNPLLACLPKLVVTFGKIKGRPRLSEQRCDDEAAYQSNRMQPQNVLLNCGKVFALTNVRKHFYYDIK